MAVDELIQFLEDEREALFKTTDTLKSVYQTLAESIRTLAAEGKESPKRLHDQETTGQLSAAKHQKYHREHQHLNAVHASLIINNELLREIARKYS